MPDKYLYIALIITTVFSVYSLRDKYERHESKKRWKLIDPSNPANQLRYVSSAEFYPRSLMNKSEYRVFQLLERWLNQNSGYGYRLFCQVSYGEFLQTADNNAYKSINSKRADFLIIDRYGEPRAVIEYQGDGHYQGDAVLRDEVKAAALMSANVELVEIFPGDFAADIEKRLSFALNTNSSN